MDVCVWEDALYYEGHFRIKWIYIKDIPFYEFNDIKIYDNELNQSIPLK